MNIIVNYDLIENIKNATEPLSPFKLVRCKKRKLCFYYVPCLTILNGLTNRHFLLPSLAISLGLVCVYETFPELMARVDPFSLKAKSDLHKLASQLRDNNINTNYDMLLASQVEAKEYHLQLNEHKLPTILEQKYILVPSYGFDNTIRDTSIVQEHVIGSRHYVLSSGRYNPHKKLSLVRSNA